MTLALLSVWDKTGIVELAKALTAKNIGILSSGGTARALREAGIPANDFIDTAQRNTLKIH